MISRTQLHTDVANIRSEAVENHPKTQNTQTFPDSYAYLSRFDYRAERE